MFSCRICRRIIYSLREQWGNSWFLCKNECGWSFQIQEIQKKLYIRRCWELFPANNVVLLSASNSSSNFNFFVVVSLWDGNKILLLPSVLPITNKTIVSFTTLKTCLKHIINTIFQQKKIPSIVLLYFTNFLDSQHLIHGDSPVSHWLAVTSQKTHSTVFF